MVRSHRNSDRQRNVLQRREVTKSIKKAKNDWLQDKAREVEVDVVQWFPCKVDLGGGGGEGGNPPPF